MQPSYGWMLSSENLQEVRRVNEDSVNLSTQMNVNGGLIGTSFIQPPTGMSSMQQPSISDYLQPVLPLLASSQISRVVADPIEQSPTSSSLISSQQYIKEISPESSTKATVQQIPIDSKPIESSHFMLESSREEIVEEDRYVDPDTNEKWIRCQNPFCRKWRFVPDDVDVPMTDPWFCIMNTWDEEIASCAYRQLYEARIISAKKEDQQRSWLPRLECHFERITPDDSV